MLPFKLVYSDDYFLPIGSHVFPAEKYQRVHDRLIQSAITAPSDFVVPRSATDQDVLLVHTPQYVEKLKTGTLSAREELELEIQRLEKEMRQAAKDFEFEKAAAIRDQVKKLKKTAMEFLSQSEPSS